MATTNSLISLTTLKDDLQMPASTTRYDAAMQRAIDSVARQFSQYMKRRYWSATETRYYTAVDTMRLLTDDILAVSSIDLDPDGDSSFDRNMTATCYLLSPFNATMQDPPQPFTEILVANNSSCVFPTGVLRGVRIQGTFGACMTSDCPADLVAAALFQSREDFNLNLSGESAGGRDFSVDTPRRLAGIHPSVRRILDVYRRRVIA